MCVPDDHGLPWFYQPQFGYVNYHGSDTPSSIPEIGECPLLQSTYHGQLPLSTVSNPSESLFDFVQEAPAASF